MSTFSINTRLELLDAKLKTNGIGLINSHTGDIEMKSGFMPESLKILKNSLDKNRFDEINLKFNSIFYNWGLPELVTIKHLEYSEFIWMMDEEHIIYFVLDNARVNYSKIKIYLAKAFES